MKMKFHSRAGGIVNAPRPSPPVSSSTLSSCPSQRRSERGYTLVALLALMTIMMLLLMSAAPSIRQQTLRDREDEAIFRGEEVAEAIRLYIRATNQLPTSMEQLMEGIPRGSKKVQVLPQSATRDPLSTKGEWKLIHPTDPEFLEFRRAVALYAGGQLPPPTDKGLQTLQNAFGQITSVLDTGSKDKAPCDESDAENSSGPFVGVASRNRCNSVINYYSIDRHDHWVFTPFFR
jgi:type II secretory pathway pseudopilin PulG